MLWGRIPENDCGFWTVPNATGGEKSSIIQDSNPGSPAYCANALITELLIGTWYIDWHAIIHIPFNPVTSKCWQRQPKQSTGIYMYNHRSYNIEKSSVMQLHGTLHVDHIHIQHVQSLINRFYMNVLPYINVLSCTDSHEFFSSYNDKIWLKLSEHVSDLQHQPARFSFHLEIHTYIKL